MISFFKKFNFFEKIKAYFIKIIKLSIFIVKKVFSSFFKCFLRLVKNIKNNINQSFQFKRPSKTNGIAEKIKNLFQEKFNGFLYFKKNREKSFLRNSILSRSWRRFLFQGVEKDTNLYIKKNFYFLSCIEISALHKNNKQDSFFDLFDELPITRRIAENYLFWLQFKRQSSQAFVENTPNISKILNCVIEIIEYLFILLFQLILLTIFTSLELCCDITNQLSILSEKISMLLNGFDILIDDLIFYIEERVEKIESVISSEIEFECFDCLEVSTLEMSSLSL